MRLNRSSQYPYFAQATLALLLLCLWGCTAAPVQEEKPEPLPPPVEPPPPVVDKNAALTLPQSTYSPNFRDAENLLAEFRWMEASDVLASIPREGLNTDDSIYLGYLQARIDYVRGYPGKSAAVLQQLDRPGMHPALQYRILNFQRYIEEMSGDYLLSARLGNQLLGLAPPAHTRTLQREIWHDLQRLEITQLQQALVSAQDKQWQGWLELALLSRSGLNQSTGELALWLQANPDHPAAHSLPGGLAYLLGPPQTPRRVALLLPLSGRLAPAGKAVRDGYLASYYAARQAGEANYEIIVMDLDQQASAVSAYDSAVAQGADFVIGPLSKEAVAELYNRPSRPIPVLALNRHEEGGVPTPGSSALVQLSLAPEDEAATIASRAFGQGARSALVIRPEGDWGSKVAQALLKQWQELGGTIANSVTYDDRANYSARVKEALGILASEQRAQDIRSMLATNIEFSARRRQDIDVIFLLSGNGAEARSLKPLLAFHYAGGLPVYSTSSIYSGTPDPRDRDLDGINFVETPWLLESAPALRTAIAASGNGNNAYTRLNALGVDAHLLQSRFLQLQAGPDALLRGSSGLLSMDPQLQILRELSLVTFDGGAIKSQ